MSSSYSRSWISERLRIEITLPSHDDNSGNSDALFIHPNVAVYEINKSVRISSPGALGVCHIAPPPPHHHSMVVMNSVLTAPLRVPDGDIPLLMVGEDSGEFFHGEVGSLVRNLIIYKLIAHSNMKTFTMSGDPSVRFVAVVTAISVSRRLDTTAPLTSHLPEAIRGGDEDAREGNICLPPSSKSATKKEENTVSTATTSATASSSTSEAEDEMLRVLEPLWSFKSNMREATFRHSRSQQVPVTEAFLQKLGFAAGSFTLSSTTAAGSSTESQLGVQSSPSSQCGQSVSDFDDDDDEFVDQGEDIEVHHHHPIHATDTQHHQHHRISSPESVTAASIDTMFHI